MSYLTALVGAGLLVVMFAAGLIASDFGRGEKLLTLLARLDGQDWAHAMVAEMAEQFWLPAQRVHM